MLKTSVPNYIFLRRLTKFFNLVSCFTSTSINHIAFFVNLLLYFSRLRKTHVGESVCTPYVPPSLHPPQWLLLKSLLLFFKASVIASIIGFAYHRQCHYHHIHKRYLNHGECEGGRGERVNMNSSHFGSYSSH